MNRVVENTVDKSIILVEKSVYKAVHYVRVDVKKLFGFIKNNVRLSTFGCSVDKYYTVFPQFGFVRFTSVINTILQGFTLFPHSLLLLLFI